MVREDIPWDAATRSAGVDFPRSGVACVLWPDPDDQYPAALSRLIDALWTDGASAAGYAAGEKDAVRYVIESAGDGLVVHRGYGGEGAWLARSTQVPVEAATRSSALSLLDGWTPGVVIALALIDVETLATIVRTGGGGIVVALGAGAPADARAIIERLPAGRRHEASVDERSALHAMVGSRRAVFAMATGAVLIAATVAGVTLWRLHGGTSESSAGIQTNRPTPDTPSFPSVSLLATDPSTGKLLLVGCCDVDAHGAQTLVSTWLWSGIRWTHVHPAASPPFQRDATLAVAAANVVLQTWVETSAQTWTWDGQAWTLLPTAQVPPAHTGPSVYDTGRAQVITLSRPPLSQSGQADTWALQSGGTWTQISSGGPQLFLPPAVADDPDRRQVVLVETDGVTMTTWTFADGTWTRRSSADNFALDSTVELTWDGVYHKVIGLHLGDAAFPLRNSTTPADTWTWDGSSWSMVPTISAPNENGRLLTTRFGRAVFVGDHAINGSPDVWEWAGTTWRLRTGNLSDLFAGPGGIVFDFDPALLDAAGWAVRLSGARAVVDAGSARDAAYGAVPAPSGVLTEAHVRLRVSDQATVINIADPNNPVLCECWIEDVLLTRFSSCPGAEVVEQESLVLVDMKDGRVIKTYTHTPPPGTTFGSCQQAPITTP